MKPAPHVWIPDRTVQPDVYGRAEILCPLEGCDWQEFVSVPPGSRGRKEADHQMRALLDAHIDHDHREECKNRGGRLDERDLRQLYRRWGMR